MVPGLPHSSVSKESACNAWDLGSIPGLGRSPRERNGNPLQYSCLENPMDRGAWWAAVHGVARVRQDWVTSFSCIGEGNGNPLQCSCLENPGDGRAWWAAAYGVAQSRTQLRLFTFFLSFFLFGSGSHFIYSAGWLLMGFPLIPQGIGKCLSF